MKKKGAGWVAWILITALFISLSTTVIIWAKNRSESITESSTFQAEIKMQCKSVLVSTTGDCDSLEVKNKGMIHIKKLEVWKGEDMEYSDPIPVSQSINLNNLDNPNNIATLLPIIEIKGKEATCREKKLIINC